MGNDLISSISSNYGQQPRNLSNMFTQNIDPVGTLGGSNSSGGLGSFFGNSQNINSLFGGVKSLGQMYFGYQQQKMAKKTMKAQLSQLNQNSRNAVVNHNRRLKDMYNARLNSAGKAKRSKMQSLSSYLNENGAVHRDV